MTDEQMNHIFDDVKHYRLTFVFLSGTKVERIVNEADMKRVFSLPSDSYIFETPGVDPLSFNRDQLEYIDCRDYWPKLEAESRRFQRELWQKCREEELAAREKTINDRYKQPQKRTWF